MLKDLFNIYMNNYFVKGTLNLTAISLIITAATLFFIGHEKKKPRDRQHPLFGKYTINIPNMMSYLRFPLGFLIFFIFAFKPFHTEPGSFILHLSFALVCMFDVLDGKFARKWNAITEGGKSLDPAADKWVTFCLATTALFFGNFPWWAFILILMREIISMIQRAIMKKKGEDVSAKWLGKIKTGVQFTVLYIILLRIDFMPKIILLDSLAAKMPAVLILWGVLLTCFCTLISLFPFFKSFSYVNNYKQTQREECNKPWYIVCIPNLLTVGNYLCGITAVFFAMPSVEVQHRSFVILFWVLAAALCDAFDGPLARKLKSYSDFGSCLDSSTDLSTFGLATAIVIFLRFSEIKGGSSLLGIIIALIYFSFVHLRLARFTKINESQDDLSTKRDFVGLPSPSGSLGVLIIFTFFNNVWVLSLSILFLTFLMYSNFNLISHSNSLKHPLYRYFQIPMVFSGFLMLTVLIFQQPFVSNHFAKDLKVYFKLCSWILFLPLLIYILDGFYRTYKDKKTLKLLD